MSSAPRLNTQQGAVLTIVQPAIIFAGELFEKEEALGHAKGLLLDFFRGRQVNSIALKVCACFTRLRCSLLDRCYRGYCLAPCCCRACNSRCVTHSLSDWKHSTRSNAAHPAESDT